MENKSINLGCNETKFQADSKVLIELSKQVPELKFELSNKFAIELTAKNFEDIVLSNGKLALKEITKAYNADIKAVRLMTGKEAIKQQFEQSKQLLNELILKYSGLKRLLSFGIVSELGEYSFNEGYLDKLRQEHSKILTDEKEIALYQQKQIALKEFEKFKSLIKISRVSSVPVQSFAAMVMSDELTDFSTLAHGGVK